MPSTIGKEKRAAIAAAWSDIVAKVAAGARVDHSCAAHGFDRVDLFLFRQGSPELQQQWIDAMQDSADAYLDKLVDVMTEAETNAKGARVKASILQWMAEKRNPDKYGQRTRADINVKSVDLTQIIKDANARLAAAKQPQVIDHATQQPITDNSAGQSGTYAHRQQESFSAAQDAIEHATLHAAGLL